MEELVREMSRDIKEVRNQLIELVKNQAVMNQCLIEHERRSTNLEIRVDPLEKDYSFRTKLFSIFVGCGGLAVLSQVSHLLNWLTH